MVDNNWAHLHNLLVAFHFSPETIDYALNVILVQLLS